MKFWIIFHTTLMTFGFLLMIFFIINGGTFYILLNAFTFIGNAIMLFFELKHDALHAVGDGGKDGQ